MAEIDQRFEVAIAGGGPVGLVVALELGRRGIRCIVLNDRPDTATHPKANAIGARTMEHLRRLGVAAAVRAAGLDDDHPTDVAYFTRLTGRELARLRLPCRTEALRLAQAGAGPWANAPEPPHRCSQIFLERALKDACARHPSVTLRFGWRVSGFAEGADGVAIDAVEVASGRGVRLSADYLVGCDGGSSLVRKSLGIELAGESGVVRPFMGGSMFTAYFRATGGRNWLTVGRSWQYWVLNPEVRALLIHIDSRDLFLVMINMPPGTDVASLDVGALLQHAAGAPVSFEPLSIQPWTAGHALVAQSYGRGRVYIAGDAAHLFTPTGGLGMNTGIDDAVNLAWKLAALCRRWGGPHLLASYEAERRPIGLRNTAFARGFATSVGTVPVTPEIERDSEPGRAERAALGSRLAAHAFNEFVIPGIQLGLSYAGSPLVAPDGTVPPAMEPTCYQPAAVPGLRAPHVWLADGRALYDALGPEFTLLRLGGTAIDPAPLAEAAASRGVPLAVLDLPGEDARDVYAADLALIRPDQHVAWRGNRLPADPHALIERIRGG